MSVFPTRLPPCMLLSKDKDGQENPEGFTITLLLQINPDVS